MSNSTGNGTGDDVTVTETVFYLSSGAVGVVLNFVVLYIASRYIDMEDKPRQIIVVNMTMADFLFCLVYVSTRPFLSLFPIWSCRAYYITIWTCQLCSCVNLLWLNLDKLIFIQWPLHYYQVVNRRRMIWLSIVTWTALITMAVVVDSFMIVQGDCIKVHLAASAYLPILVVYVLLIVLSFACSAVIYCIAQTSTRMEPIARTQMLRRLLFLFSSTLWTFFTCLPYRILYLTASIAPIHRFSFFETYVNTTHACFKLLVVGIVINPIITVATQFIYRNRVLIFCRKTKRSSHSEFDSVVSARKTSSKPFLETIPLNRQ